MLPKKRSANGATATNGRTEKYRTFREQFEDPLNADALMNCRLKTAAHVAEMADLTQRNEGDTEEEAADDGDNVDSDPSTEEDEAQGGGGRRFRGLNFKKNGANQKNVFLAVCYLTGRIPELLQGDVVEFSTSKNGRCFKMLARELSESEPTLRGVTGPALQTMYMRIAYTFGRACAIYCGTTVYPTIDCFSLCALATSISSTCATQFHDSI
ncbi:hypothetical protein EC991_003301 [Linnemannia zychae]|nr:hypothetical protein EC991_003301 [Linnemannia zychae]